MKIEEIVLFVVETCDYKAKGVMRINRDAPNGWWDYDNSNSWPYEVRVEDRQSGNIDVRGSNNTNIIGSWSIPGVLEKSEELRMTAMGYHRENKFSRWEKKCEVTR